MTLTWEKIAMYTLAIVALIVLIIGPAGVFGGVKDVFSALGDYVSIGEEKIEAAELTISKEHDDQITSLKNAIKKIGRTNETDCFYPYEEGFTDLKGVSLSFDYDPKTKSTHLRIFGGAGGQQFIKDEVISGVKPCVIAGSEGIVFEFSNRFLKKPFKEEEGDFYRDAPYYKEVDSLSIRYDTGARMEGILCLNGNRIIVPGFDVVVCDNLKDRGVIFSPKKGTFCFLPTRYFFKDEKGLANGNVFD